MALAQALRQLREALDRLAAFMVGSAGCLLSLEAWMWRRGAQSVPPLLPAALMGVVALASSLWLSAQRRLGRWTLSLDERLGPGSGQALLDLGRLPEDSFQVEEGRDGWWAGPAEQRDARGAARLDRLCAVAGPLTLAAAALLPLPLELRWMGLGLGLATGAAMAAGAGSLGRGPKTG